jgi:hypothetical protein
LIRDKTLEQVLSALHQFNMPKLGFSVTEKVHTKDAMHVILKKESK